MQVSERVSEAEDREAREPLVKWGRHLVQGQSEVTYRALSDGRRNSVGQAGLDVSTAGPAEIPTPAAVQDVSQPAPQPTVRDDVRPWEGSSRQDIEAFLAGYFTGGGDPTWEQRVLSMVECESGWRLDPPGPHLGLAQFAPGTWEQASCSPEADYRDPWEQGCAVVNWMQQIPGRWGTSEGWPGCWN